MTTRLLSDRLPHARSSVHNPEPILSSGPLLGAEAFFGEGLDGTEVATKISESLADYLMSCERDYLMLILDRHDGHMTHAAEALGITRKTLWEKLRRLGVKAKGEG